MHIDTVKQDIERWIINFVEMPHPLLGGFPPCPYARSARLAKAYEIVLGTDPKHDLAQRGQHGMQDREVWIYVYDPQQWSHHRLSELIESANTQTLLPKDMIALEDHPDDIEDVNNVIMNQGTYALILVQNLSYLNQRAKTLAKYNFYDSWPEPYLQSLFRHRRDPRS